MRHILRVCTDAWHSPNYVEVNYLADIARTDADYVRKSLSAVRDHGFEGAVPCCNVMEAPDEHIEAVAG